MWDEEFSEVSGGCTMQTAMGVKEDFESNLKVNEEPVQATKNGVRSSYLHTLIRIRAAPFLMFWSF